MFETPDHSHLKEHEYSSVYDPAEDTFLLLDALEAEYEFLRNLNPSIILEIGSGSGVVSCFIKRLFPLSVCFCTDINNASTKATCVSGHLNKVDLEIINCNLVDPLIERLKNKVDILLFNPPYVVTPPSEIDSCSASWAGGDSGRQIIDKVLPFVSKLLTNNGCFYMVVIKENNIDDIRNIMNKLKIQVNIILNRRCGLEFLSILKLFYK